MAEQYIAEFGKLAKEGNSLIMPASVSDVGSMVAMAMNIIKQGNPTAFLPPRASKRDSYLRKLLFSVVWTWVGH